MAAKIVPITKAEDHIRKVDRVGQQGKKLLKRGR